MNQVRITLHDFKGEMLRMLPMFPGDSAVFYPDQLPVNILEPKGNVRMYYQGLFAALRKYSNLRDETWTELPGFLMRMQRSRRPIDPPPSLVDLHKALVSAAEKERRPNLLTAARAIATLIEVLGRTARIRQVNTSE